MKKPILQINEPAKHASMFVYAKVSPFHAFMLQFVCQFAICCKFVNLLQFIIKNIGFRTFLHYKMQCNFFLKKINLIREILLNI
jgi:hypothetical protein